jgi:hypothetical protein
LLDGEMRNDPGAVRDAVHRHFDETLGSTS